MSKEPLKILGINPGTRYLGLAIFQDWNLLDWRICTFGGKWSAKKLNHILDQISEYIELFDINTIALKKLHQAHSSPQLRLLVSRIKALAKKKKINVYQKSIKEVEDLLLIGGRHNKRKLAEKMAVDYPILAHEFKRDQARKNHYLLRMFETVALGAVCFQKQVKL